MNKPRCDHVLDRVVEGAHDAAGSVGYHPYLAMFDLAMIAGLAVGYLFSVRFGGIGFARWCAVFAVEVALYAGYLAFKRRALGIASRSFLQDTLFFLMPTYLAVSLVVGHPIGAALDVVGLMFPLVLGTIRLGCFLGGCCYGRPVAWGVLYAPRVFAARGVAWRAFVPGAPTGERVLPIQLLESCVCYAIFAALFARLAHGAALDGRSLGWFFLGYGAWRFAAEPLRGTRHRPKWGPLSQAQWLSLALLPLCVAWLTR
jgi:prolipoprotein diacylglyceryltransferase